MGVFFMPVTRDIRRADTGFTQDFVGQKAGSGAILTVDEDQALLRNIGKAFDALGIVP